MKVYLMFISHSCQVKELQKQTGVRIKVVAGNEDSENKEAVILIEESFASGQVSILQYFVSLFFFAVLPTKSCNGRFIVRFAKILFA